VSLGSCQNVGLWPYTRARISNGPLAKAVLIHICYSCCSREHHKVAIYYVAPGQEEESEILANERGSQQYEDFLTSIGWEVDLRTHSGLLGGLQPDTHDKVCMSGKY
jgi:hypothetical protein